MAQSWIWQQPDWPQFRWEGSALEPLLEQARAARQELLSRLETLEPPLDREAISALLGRESLGTPSARKDDASSPTRPHPTTRGLDGAEQCVVTARRSKLM